MPNDGIRLKIILIIEVRKLEFTDFDSHSPILPIESLLSGIVMHFIYSFILSIIRSLITNAF